MPSEQNTTTDRRADAANLARPNVMSLGPEIPHLVGPNGAGKEQFLTCAECLNTASAVKTFSSGNHLSTEPISNFRRCIAPILFHANRSPPFVRANSIYHRQCISTIKTRVPELLNDVEAALDDKFPIVAMDPTFLAAKCNAQCLVVVKSSRCAATQYVNRPAVNCCFDCR